MLEGEFFRFDGTALIPCADTVSEVRLAAADSWLVEDGRTRSLEAHYARFGAWVAEFAPELVPNLPAFNEAVTNAIPLEGNWNPRIELHLACEDSSPKVATLYFRHRSAPELQSTARLWTLDEPDPRAIPRVKGPDLSLGMQIRRKAILHNADEAALLTADGYLEEGALSAIVWWRGDVLCAPDASTPWLESITRNEVFALAQAMGYQTRVERVKPADLVGLEIWVLSSLHGIRPVTEWVNLGSPVGPAKHAESFQKRMRMLSRQIR